MSKLSLKRHHSISEESQNEECFCSKSPIDNIEVTSDESDNLQNNEIVESEKKSTSPLISNISYDEKTLNKFEQSTDSIESNEDDTESMFYTNSKISMFNWNKQRSKLNTSNVGKYSDSDSSDKHTSKISKRKRRHKKKKHKKKQEIEIQHELLISGIKVKLPVKPYSCQIAVMNKVRIL